MHYRSLVLFLACLLVAGSAFAEKCVPRSFSGGSHMQSMTCFPSSPASKVASQKHSVILQSFSGGRSTAFAVSSR